MLNKLLNEVLDFVYPPGEKCCFCERTLSYWQKFWCVECKERIDYAKKILFFCRTCARFIAHGDYCSYCKDNEYVFDLARSVGLYDGLLKEAIHDFKYRSKQSLAKPLGCLISLEAITDRRFLDCDVIVPVPMFSAKLEKRNFNQSELLAAEISGHIGIDYDPLILEKIVDTPEMVGLSREERFYNLKGAFRVNDEGRIKGNKIMLVDDIFTTGFTASLCSETLFNADAREVVVFVLASSFDK